MGGKLAELGRPVGAMRLLPGGASKEAWAVDAHGDLLVRRAGVGVIYEQTLSLAHEFAVLEAAYEAGVRVPRPVAYLGDVGGREAFAMERVSGETIGRRIVHAAPGLAAAMAEELREDPRDPRERVPFLGGGSILERVEHERRRR